jgi:hypothetical protein
LFLFGTVTALLALLARRRGLWLYALVLLTIGGAVAYPVMLTGHAAEDIMRKVWYVDKDSIEAHEDAADTATWTMIGAGVIAALALWRLSTTRRHVGLAGEETEPAEPRLPSWAQGLVIIAALAGLGTVAYAALQGGKIVHDADRLKTPPPGMSVPVDTTPMEHHHG